MAGVGGEAEVLTVANPQVVQQVQRVALVYVAAPLQELVALVRPAGGAGGGAGRDLRGGDEIKTTVNVRPSRL